MYDGRFRVCLMSCLASHKAPDPRDITASAEFRTTSIAPRGNSCKRDVGNDCAGQSHSACPVQSVFLVEQVSVHAGVGGLRGPDLLLGFVRVVGRQCQVAGFFRVDAGVFAKINETWRAQLNIENVFNKGYWASADGNNNISPGQPRTVRLTAFAKF